MSKIKIKGTGEIPAKAASDFAVDEWIAGEHGYHVKVVEILSINDNEINFKVEHHPSENEYYNDSDYHEVSYPVNELLGIAKDFFEPID